MWRFMYIVKTTLLYLVCGFLLKQSNDIVLSYSMNFHFYFKWDTLRMLRFCGREWMSQITVRNHSNGIANCEAFETNRHDKLEANYNFYWHRSGHQSKRFLTILRCFITCSIVCDLNKLNGENMSFSMRMVIDFRSFSFFSHIKFSCFI